MMELMKSTSPRRRRSDRWASPIVRAVLVSVASAAAGWSGNAVTTSLTLVGRVAAVESGLARVEERAARIEAMLSSGSASAWPHHPALRAGATDVTPAAPVPLSGVTLREIGHTTPATPRVE